MPYSKNTLTQSGDALNLEMKGYLDAALTAHPAWTQVTTGYVSGTKTYDVWENDGTTDGYGWFLIVNTDTANDGRVALGGALEYDPATNIAKKALRGYNGLGYVDAAGYPLVAAGGAEMTFPLGGFIPTGTIDNGMVGAGNSWSTVVAATSGNIFRVIVTGHIAWTWWGTTGVLGWCHGVGTYENLHSTTADLKPLGFLLHDGTYYPSTVWQSPSATEATRSRACFSDLGGTYGALPQTITVSGEVGGKPDLLYGGPIGSRIAVIRNGGTSNVNTLSGAAAYSDTGGTWLGIMPGDDFLIFDRSNAVQIGDTITVNGKIYESVLPPSTYPGLFVNTQVA